MGMADKPPIISTIKKSRYALHTGTFYLESTLYFKLLISLSATALITNEVFPGKAILWLQAIRLRRTIPYILEHPLRSPDQSYRNQVSGSGQLRQQQPVRILCPWWYFHGSEAWSHRTFPKP